MRDVPGIINQILEFLSEKPASVQEITLGTRLHGRTVRKYLQIIELVQAAPKMKKEIHGARVFFRREI